MYVHRIPLETRPAGTGVISSESDVPLPGTIEPGCTVTLRFRDVRILAQVLELEPDRFFVGQVIDFDGTAAPEIQGVRSGSYLRFRYEHIFLCNTDQ